MSNDKMITIPANMYGFTPDDLRKGARALDTRSVDGLLYAIARYTDAQHPPRMDEPDWGEKVEASHRCLKDSHEGIREVWLHSHTDTWTTAAGDDIPWDSLIDPTPLP